MATQLVDVNGNAFLTDVVAQGVNLGALNAASTLQLRGQATASVQLTSIGSLTAAFEATVDNVNWFAVVAIPFGGGAGVTTTTANGQWTCDVAGCFGFRVRVSAYTSGSVVASVIASQGASVFGSTSATGNARTDLISVAGTALGTPTNFGTTPGAVVAESVNSSAFIGTTVAVAASAGIQKVGIVGNAGSAAIFDGATGAAVPAGALADGARAQNANPTAVTNGQLVNLAADLGGRLIVTLHAYRTLIKTQALASAATAETTFITAGGASVFNDLIMLIITTAAALASAITIRDVTAGGTPWIINYPNQAAVPNAPLILNFNPPLQQGTANSAWTFAQTAANALNITAQYVQRLA